MQTPQRTLYSWPASSPLEKWNLSKNERNSCQLKVMVFAQNGQACGINFSGLKLANWSKCGSSCAFCSSWFCAMTWADTAETDFQVHQNKKKSNKIALFGFHQLLTISTSKALNFHTAPVFWHHFDQHLALRWQDQKRTGSAMHRSNDSALFSKGSLNQVASNLHPRVKEINTNRPLTL